jgi:hypothetical protein
MARTQNFSTIAVARIRSSSPINRDGMSTRLFGLTSFTVY